MKEYIIWENDSNQRLDKFLKKLFSNASSSLVYKLNRKWKIKVNDKKEDNEYKLQINDKVKIFLNDYEFGILTKKENLESKNLRSKTKFDRKNIVYEDGDILVINKEPWINVHPWDHKTTETNIISQIQDYLWNKLNSLTFKPSLVHRIDRDTSGILIIWKKKQALTKLVSDFKNHKKVKKIYYAIVFWKLPSKTWIINLKLIRIKWARDENKVQVSDKGQEAITNYKLINEHIIKTSQGDIYVSEVEVEILTWRMHQIRVHLASIWCPIVWDNKYWNKKLNSYISKNYSLYRQALHAWKIEFNHPIKNKKMRLEAHLKKDLVEFINKL